MVNQKQIKITLLIYAAAVFFSFTFPIHTPPFRTYFQELFAALSIMLPIGYLACLPQVSWRVPKIVILPVILVVTICIQISCGSILYPMDMVLPILVLICFAAAIIFGSTLAGQEDGLERLITTLAIAFVVTGLVSVLLQQLQLLNLQLQPFVFPLLTSNKVRPYANMAQPNLLALLLLFSLAATWMIYLKRKINPPTGLIIALLLLWGLALTQSRIAWIILPIYAVFCWHQPTQTQKISKFVYPVLMLAFIGFVYVLPHFISLFGFATESVGQRAGQTSVRLVLWQQALQMSLMHPWIGVGWAQFGSQQILLCTLFSPTEYADNAHNVLMNLVAEIGWPITVAIFAGMAYWFYAACIRRWSNIYVRFASLIFLAIAIHSSVEFPLWSCFMLFPFGVLLGALHPEQLGWETYQPRRGWVMVIFVISTVVVAGASWDYMRVVNGFIALKYQQEGKKSPVGSTEMPEWTLFSNYYDYFRVVKIAVGPGMPKEDLDFLGKISLRFGHPAVLGRLALAYANNQRPGEAIQVLLTIQRLFGDQYNGAYEYWKGYAQSAPALYAEIFNHLPVPPATTEKQDSDDVTSE
ncbi:O-antigen ligase [Oxalobacteraceae bacterium GrIS 2.11]